MKSTGIISVKVEAGSIRVLVETASDINTLLFVLQNQADSSMQVESATTNIQQYGQVTSNINWVQTFTNEDIESWLNLPFPSSHTFRLWIHAYNEDGFVETWQMDLDYTITMSG